MQTKDLRKRTKKAISHALDKLVEKYGVDAVRLIFTGYFLQVREKKNMEAEMKNYEKRIAEIRRKLK